MTNQMVKGRDKENGLEERIIYEGPQEKANETKNLVKYMLREGVLRFTPTKKPSTEQELDDYIEGRHNREARLWVDYTKRDFPKPLISIEPYGQKYKIESINIPNIWTDSAQVCFDTNTVILHFKDCNVCIRNKAVLSIGKGIY